MKLSLRLTNLLTKTIYLFWGAGIGVILFLIAISGTINYAVKIPYKCFALAVCGIVFTIGLYWCLSHITFDFSIRTVFLIGFGFFLFQLFIVKTYFFKTDWDVQTIITAAELAARGENIIGGEWYFTCYPNNLFLTYIFSLILKACYSVGISGDNAYFMILVFQSLISSVSGVLTFYLTWRLTKSDKIAMTVYVIYLLLIGLSPWVSIPYSDSTALFLPIALVTVYLSNPQKPILVATKWLSIGLFVYLGYKIKPTIFIVFIAIMIVELPKILDKFQRRDFLRHAVLSVLGICLGLGIFRLAYQNLDFDINPEGRYGMPHFLAMGLNEQSMGVWNQIHVDYSYSFNTNKERDAADWALAKEMARDMGPTRLIKQFGRKLLTNFNDGSFAWASEGIFFMEIFHTDNPVSLFIRSFYYQDEPNYGIFRNFEHSIWLSVLFFSFCSVFSRKSDDCAAIMLTMIGYVIYGMLFEARARYTFIFVPLLLVLSGVGLMHIKKLLKKVIQAINM